MMKTKINCYKCSGEGHIFKWNMEEYEDIIELLDCPNCDGKGYVRISVIDNRKINKKRRAILPDKC